MIEDRALAAFRRRYLRGEIDVDEFESGVERALSTGAKRDPYDQASMTQDVDKQLANELSNADKSAAAAYRIDHEKAQDRIDEMERRESA